MLQLQKAMHCNDDEGDANICFEKATFVSLIKLVNYFMMTDLGSIRKGPKV